MHSLEQRQSQGRSLMQDILIRINKYEVNQKNEYVFRVETIAVDSKQVIKTTFRTFFQVDNLNIYMKKQYGGFIVPVINIKKLISKNSQPQQIILKIEEYLQDLRLNYHCGRDLKFYCFIFEQAMMLPQQEKYVKVLSNASTMSKKYLNAIFTRKQLPQQKRAQQLITNYQKLLSTANQFNCVRQLATKFIREQRICQQIFMSLEQISATPCLSIQPQQNYIIEAQRILKSAQKYRDQSIQAYGRWQILVQGVRESLSSIYKGQHEDEIRYRTRSAQLKNWTKSLGDEFLNMNNCFQSFISHLCKFICKMKYASTSYVVIAEKAQCQQKINQQQYNEKEQQISEEPLPLENDTNLVEQQKRWPKNNQQGIQTQETIQQPQSALQKEG